MTKRTAVLGTGIMGAAMARNLARSGLQVRAWNRTAARAEPLAEDGIEVAGSAAEAVAGADAVVTMLRDAEAVTATMAPLLDDLGGALWLQMSTIGLPGTARAQEMAESAGVAFLDAPVLGTRAPAEQGTLVVLAAGDPALRQRAEPVLDAVGSRTMWVADRPGPASALKLVVNSWVATLNAGVGQAIALASALDLDPQLFLEAIGGGPTDTPYAHAKGALMMCGEYPTAFALDGVVKDVGLMLEAATARDFGTTLLDALREVYAAASANGLGSADMAAVHEQFRRASRPNP
ncbi:MAG TPA: NAD(P)-dependent oxidoreductase [Marmoricola sp.]|nr:NAD(P)-dependent oxidoreductase [Marmoricola sp.]